MFATSIVSIGYRYLLKPILFQLDPELAHNVFTRTGEFLENQNWLIGTFFNYKSPQLHRNVLGISFENPVGLAAGFDYDGHMAQVMRLVGFGFNTVGTVTAMPYGGNPIPRLARLPRSRSLLVNKGFKSSGAMAVRSLLDSKNLSHSTIGISVGSSNVPEINSVNKAISDYLTTFKLFADRKYVKFFELNISCPNIALKGSFTLIKNFKLLCAAVKKLNLKQPIFVKMPNEISYKESDALIEVAISNGIRGFIFSNLVKDRSNKVFIRSEISKFDNLPGNFSGAPTYAGSLKHIKHARKVFGNRIVIIGTGGIFSAKDAAAKLDAGADLVQLITGMIFEGPQLIGQINKALLL